MGKIIHQLSDTIYLESKESEMSTVMKKRILTFVMAIALVFTCFVQIPMNVAANTTDTRANAVSTATTARYNFILLLDKSGSMNITDAERLSLSAACQFVDQMSTVSNDLLDLSAVTSVGVMTFSQTSEMVTPLLSLDSEANKNYLKSEIKKIKFDKVNTGGTDLSTAANDALHMLEQQSSEDVKNVVVLFTDGYSESVLDEKASADNLTKAFELAEKLQSNIYVVGLNHNGRIKEAGQQEIFRLANTAQIGEGISGKSSNDKTSKKDTVNYLITDNIGDVREFYGKIYANMIQSDLLYIEDHEFIVESGGILEADITIYSDSKISEVIITDPDGKRMVEDATSYFVSGDDYYKVIKILNPKTGKWKVEVVSGDENYKSYVIKFYGVEAAVSAVWDTGAAFAESGLSVPFVGKVTLIPMYKGEEYVDETFLESVTTAEFTARLEGNGKEGSYPFTYVEGKYVGYFPVEQGVYDIEAVLANDIMNRKVTCTLAVTNADGTIDLELGAIWVKNQEAVTVRLPDKAGTDQLLIENIQVDADETSKRKQTVTEVTADEAGNLIVKANKTGTDRLSVTATDAYGITYHVTGKIQVQFKWLWYHMLFAVLAVSAVLSAIGIVISKIRNIPGEFHVHVELLNSDNGYEKESKENDLPSPHGTKFSLWELAKIVKEDIDAHAEDSSEGEEEISEALADEKNNISKIHIMMSENKKKKKVYLVRTARGSRELTDNIECYKSEKLSIRLSFESLFENEEEDDDDFGKASDFKNKKRTRGRKATSVFTEENE